MTGIGFLALYRTPRHWLLECISTREVCNARGRALHSERYPSRERARILREFPVGRAQLFGHTRPFHAGRKHGGTIEAVPLRVQFRA